MKSNLFMRKIRNFLCFFKCSILLFFAFLGVFLWIKAQFEALNKKNTLNQNDRNKKNRFA